MENVVQENKMAYKKMFPLIISMSIPAIFSMTVQALYNVVDSLFVSKLSDGTYALEATSLAYPLQMLLIAVAVGTAVGTNSLISRRLGSGNQKEANSAATHGLILAVLSWLIFLFIGLFLVKPFISIYNCSDITYNYSVEYLQIVMCASLFVLIQVSIEKSIQATGDMIFPMLFQLTGAVTNLILDPLLIYGIGPFPELRVAGAAYATVIGQFVATVFSLLVLFLRKNKIKVSFKNFKLSFKVIKNIYAIGFPSIIMQSISSILTFGLNSILNSYPYGVTVYGLYFKIQSFIFMPVMGLNQGVLPIMGYNYGAKNKKRLFSALKCGMLIALVIMSLGTILFWLAPEFLLNLFGNGSDEFKNIVEVGVPAFRTISICFIPAAFGILFITLYQATAKGFRALIISFTRQLVFILPVAYLLSYFFNDVNAVWWSFPIAEIGALILAIIFFIQFKNTEFKKLETQG